MKGLFKEVYLKVKKSLNELCPKVHCEVCKMNEKSILHRHHITEKTEINSNNFHMNLLVLCPTCHAKIHNNLIKIIGIFPSTDPIMKRIAVFIDENGKCNVPGMENENPYYTPQNQSMKLFTKEENE
jgi:hypothetical protein